MSEEWKGELPPRMNLDGVLRDRGQPLPQEHNPQTLAEREMAMGDRPVHYVTGMRASFCEVYHPAKGSPDWSQVTCKECLKLQRRTGR